ncbi:MAG: endonuclease domain-containing protein [Candidatus Binataceae bacterium]
MPKAKLARARALRRGRTETERKLWKLLHSRRLHGAKFRFQYPIGGYFGDFCCIKSRLIVEVDGGQHADEDEVASDRRRTAYLRSRGFRVMRFWNHDVLGRSDWVVERIGEAIAEYGVAEPSPLPSPRLQKPCGGQAATERARGKHTSSN